MSGRWPFVVQVALKKALNVQLNLERHEPDGSPKRTCPNRRCPEGSLVAYLQLGGVSGEVGNAMLMRSFGLVAGSAGCTGR